LDPRRGKQLRGNAPLTKPLYLCDSGGVDNRGFGDEKEDSCGQTE